MAADIDQQIHNAYIDALSLVASVLPDAATQRLGDWFVYDAGIDNPDFNLAVVAGDLGRADLNLGEVEEWFAARGTRWRYKLRPGPDAPVVAALGDRALEAGRREPYMWRSAHGLSPAQVPGLTIERVSDAIGLADYDSFDAARGRPSEWSVAAAVMPLPGCSLWLAYEGDVAVARAMGVSAGEVGMIHNVVVDERFRRRGYGRAITAAAALACRDAGASSVCLGASTMGYPLYLSMGFEHRYDLATFTPIPCDDNDARRGASSAPATTNG